MSLSTGSSADRKTGKVERVFGDYGFVSCDDLPDHDIYFKTAWFRGSPPLQEGEEVVFLLKTFGTNQQAHHLDRAQAVGSDAASQIRRDRSPRTDWLFDWAYLGYMPNVLGELRGLALKEHWEFKNTPPSADRPLPILHSYLLHTFGRLVLERKILVSESANLAAFNTGLVDPRYEPIHALLSPNDNPRSPWQLSGFCIAGEGADGQNLVRHFAPLPAAAHYFDNPVDLLYDVRAGKPELDWRHIVIQRIDRYPREFVEDHWPAAFGRKDENQFTPEERKDYYAALGSAIEADTRVYRRIMNRVKDAIDLSIKRVAWNFKTAIPTYYPRVKNLQLLLPLCLLSDDTVDLALAMEKTPAGSYLGHTALPLDWAYKNARLVCRPDSDWLAPNMISAESDDEEA